MNTTTLPATLAERSARLNGLHERLRKDHFGIDTEIQRLLDAFAPWYQFAETQTRPRAIGLWGMTGTGKSSIVRALVKEAGLEDRTYWLDASELNNRYGGFSEITSRIEDHLSGAPFIIVVDEFQHARTLLPDGTPAGESNEMRKFWELLDTGRVVTWPSIGRDRDLMDFQLRFKRCVREGVRVRKGRVVSNYGKFQSLVMKDRSGDDEFWGIPSRLWSDLQGMHYSPEPTLLEIESKLSGMNERGILDWLEELKLNAQRARVIDASKTLVVLLGNLDELYVGGKEPMAELDPEVLAHRHKDIGRAGVQNALLKLFRIEQIGRIGSSHVVFPPIGTVAIDAIVGSAVSTLSVRLSEHAGCRVEVDAALVDHLRATSSVAVLGARPVLEAVHNTVPLLLSQAMADTVAVGAEMIGLGISEGRPVADLVRGEQTQRMELSWPVEQTGRVEEDDRTERTAIHEVGHLVCGVRLRGRKPLQVCARTRDPRVAGFVAWEVPPVETFRRADIIPELAAILGGRAAEYLHYGASEVSAGSVEDIQQATALALGMVKNEGMGTERLHYARHAMTSDGGFRTLLPEAEAQARQWIEAAEALAMDTLKANTDLFDCCVEVLKEKGSLGMRELEALLAVEKPVALMDPALTV